MKYLIGAALAALVVLPLGGAASAQEARKPADLRFEALIGANWGDPSLSFGGAEGDLDVGTGFSVGAGVWLDRVGFDYLSLGAQYLYLRQGSYEDSGIVAIPGATATGTLEVRPSMHAFFANAALRYPEGRINPYIGGGIGFAVSKASADVAGIATINGVNYTGNGSDSDSSTNFAGQVFGGVDLGITDKVYLGVSGRYVMTDSKLLGIDVDSRIFSVMTNLGYRF